MEAKKTLFDITCDLNQLIGRTEEQLSDMIDNLCSYKKMPLLDEEEVKMMNMWQKLVDDKKVELKKMKSAYECLTGLRIK